jgi:hypothetical protein
MGKVGEVTGWGGVGRSGNDNVDIVGNSGNGNVGEVVGMSGTDNVGELVDSET